MRSPGDSGDPAHTVFEAFPARRPQAARVSSWWGKAWSRAVEEASYDREDLVRARKLARSGRLGAIGVQAGRARAAVADPRGADHSSRVEVAVLEDSDWGAFLDAAASASGHGAALLAGDLPHRLMEDAEASGVELLPYAVDLDSGCDCGSWNQPCIHCLALMTQLTWLVDADPFVMFALRGRDRGQVLAGLNARFDGADHRADSRSEAQADGSDGARSAVDEVAAGQVAAAAAALAEVILGLAAQAPTGDGLADPDVAAYDESVTGLLGGA